MNTKKFLTLFAVIAILSLGGCMATPYYGGTGYYGATEYYGGVGNGYRSQPFYGNQTLFGGHRHIGGGHRNFGGGHWAGGHRGHGGGGHRGGHHR